MRLISLVIVCLALLAGAYVWWWNQVADRTITEIAKWEEAQAKKGYQISHRAAEVSGFPYRVKVNLMDVDITFPKSADSEPQNFKVTALWAVMQPWNLFHVIFGSEGVISGRWVEDGQKVETLLKPTESLGSATFTSAGQLETLAIDLKNNQMSVRQTKGERNYTIDRVQLHARETDITETSAASQSSSEMKEETVSGWQIALRMDQITLPENADNPLGNKISKAAISTFIQGNPLDLKSKDQIRHWRDEGGAIDIQGLDLNWGKSRLNATGSLTLDSEDRPLGAFKATFTEYHPLLDLLVATHHLKPTSLRTATFVLDTLSKENEQAERYLDIPVSLQEGAVFVGPLRLFKLESVL